MSIYYIKDYQEAGWLGQHMQYCAVDGRVWIYIYIMVGQEGWLAHLQNHVVVDTGGLGVGQRRVRGGARQRWWGRGGRRVHYLRPLWLLLLLLLSERAQSGSGRRRVMVSVASDVLPPRVPPVLADHTPGRVVRGDGRRWLVTWGWWVTWGHQSWLIMLVIKPEINKDNKGAVRLGLK